MKRTMLVWSVVGICVLALGYAYPWLYLLITSFVLILIALVVLLRLYNIAKSKPHDQIDANKPTSKSKELFVSIHIACANESAQLVNAALDSLAALDYEPFEVLVIHNNNTQQRNWKKIEQHCAQLSTRRKQFKFYHLDSVAGYKAGALNFLNQYTDPAADIVAIIDSDYQIQSDFLRSAVSYFHDPKVGLVQFPQDYRNTNDKTNGLTLEYRAFFTVLMNAAQQLDSVIFTGTMGLIRAKLFGSQLTWNEWCITEDTEAGFQIHNLGYRGVYIDHSMGQGLMPFDYLALIRQRRRWVYGNEQVLRKDLVPVLMNQKFSNKQKASFISQLTTWFQFDVVLLSILLGALILYMFTLQPLLFTAVVITLIALMLLLAYDFWFYFLYMPARRNVKKSVGWQAFMTHRALTYTMSVGWFLRRAGYKLGFEVTKKDRFHHVDHAVGVSYEHRLLSITFLAVVIASLSGQSVIALTLLLYAYIQLRSIRYLSSSLAKDGFDAHRAA